jgi:hypothetical protein
MRNDFLGTLKEHKKAATMMFALHRHVSHRVSRRLSSSTARPFHILGLQHIAVGALDKEILKVLWQDVFGLTKMGSYASVSENVDEDILRLGRGPLAVEVDLMTSIDPDVSPEVSAWIT